MIARTYDDWRRCIEEDCGIALTQEFIKQRLDVYTDASNSETKKFIDLYGAEHLNNIVRWLQMEN